jgi:hypothetical protein
MRDAASPLHRSSDEQPAGARLHRDMHLPPPILTHPLLDRRGGRCDPPPAALAGRRVQAIEGDLAQVHVKPGDDRPR